MQFIVAADCLSKYKRNRGQFFMKKILSEYILIIIGCLIVAIDTSFLIVPAKIGSGGVTGIAIGLNSIHPIFKVGTVTLLLNIPLFLFAYKMLGKRFTLKSIVAVALSSVTIDILSPYSHEIFNVMPMQDKLLIAILAGVLSGLGLAVVYMAGGSTGGSDILAKMLVRKKQEVDFSTIQLILDILVYVFLGAVMGISTIVYALVASYTKKKTIDAIQEGFSSTKQCFIICDKADEIAQAINTEIVRGVTRLEGTGMYKKEPRNVLYTVVHISEISQVKSIVQSIDGSAFISVSSVNSIYGNFNKKGVSI